MTLLSAHPISEIRFGGKAIRKVTKKKLAGAGISIVVLWSLLAYYGWAIDGYHMFGGPIELLPFFLFSAPAVAGLSYVCRGQMIEQGRTWTPKSLTIIVLMGTVLFTPILMQGLGWANRLLDPKPVYNIQVETSAVVLFKKSARGRARKSSKMIFSGWPADNSFVYLRGTWEQASVLEKGDPVELTVGDGLFGIPYVIGYRKLD